MFAWIKGLFKSALATLQRLGVNLLEKNVNTVLCAGLLSAFALGVFKLLFPFYLSYKGISLVHMGLVFSISTLAISFFRVFLDELGDIYGRKKIYVASCGLGITSKSLFSVSFNELEILGNKFLSDLGDSLRNSSQCDAMRKR